MLYHIIASTHQLRLGNGRWKVPTSDDNVASIPNSSSSYQSSLGVVTMCHQLMQEQNGLNFTDLCGCCETDECQDTADIFLSECESAIDDTKLYNGQCFVVELVDTEIVSVQ